MVRDLIVGTMNASKSAQLLMKAYNLERQGKKILVFKPEIDTRDGEYVISRALTSKRKAIVIPKDAKGAIKKEVSKHRPNVIFVDELQFFTTEQIEELADISLNYDVDIYAYGLMIAYNGKMFEATKRAIECGFRLVVIDMQCENCRNDASHHLLYVNGELIVDGDGIFVGDQEYKSVCFDCYQKAINKKSKK